MYLLTGSHRLCLPSVLWQCYSEEHLVHKKLNDELRCFCGICLEWGAKVLYMIVPVPLPSQSPVCLINFLNGFAISIPAYLEEKRPLNRYLFTCSAHSYTVCKLIGRCRWVSKPVSSVCVYADSVKLLRGVVHPRWQMLLLTWGRSRQEWKTSAAACHFSW